MDVLRALDWSPPAHWDRIRVIDAHTGGEPFRVVIDGLPEIPGDTVLDRLRHASRHLDHYRRLLMWEPRGHADMYGAFLGPPTEPGSDLAVLFIHNAGFSTMCGHGIIALTKVVLDTGILPAENPSTTIRIDTPAGLVTATAQVGHDGVSSVSFRNVPSFVLAEEEEIEVEGYGVVRYDLAFGGAFYAFVDSVKAGVDLSDAGQLIVAGRAMKSAIAQSRKITHPFQDDLSFLYGVIFIGPPVTPGHTSRNVCVFADGEIDRSPTGTGVSARVAIGVARGSLELGETMTVESIVGSTFTGRAAEKTRFGPFEAVIPEVSGRAHIVGRSEFWVDPEDEIGAGFLIR